MNAKELKALRFLSNCNTVNDCWVWSGARPGEYGRFSFNGTRTSAHRASHEIFIGDIPQGYYVNHTCNNKSCVNPSHLESVTPSENTMYHYNSHALKSVGF